MSSPSAPGPQPPAAAPTGASVGTGDVLFDAYTEAMDTGDTPLLGHLVLYSIFDGDVTRDDLEKAFRELGLEEDLLPPPLREVDAFERVTGPDGVRVSYPLDDPRATGPASRHGRRRGRQPVDAATLMIRPVRRDGEQIIRHVVREVRDEKASSLTYDTRLATCTFRRASSAGSPEGAGTLDISPNNAAIARLPEAEQETVREMLDAVGDTFRRRCTFLTSDKLRSVLRRYVEYLDGIKVRPTGGVYFVHRRHAETLRALRDLVGRFGQGSHFVRVPLPDQEEMREMIVAAFTTRAKDDLAQLAQDIAAAQRSGKTEDAMTLHQRFRALEQTTAEHSELLSSSLDDTHAALDLVKLQLGGLLAAAA
ncbi:DUF6744 family protein [Streptomyces sp. NPDC014733]|uniref:DUF6744 family protein n=1 Tax=Streptomyces sp. NPDC014733 TaxID=3364885 RepID=UPI0036F7E1CE